MSTSEKFDPLTIETPDGRCGWDGVHSFTERICLREFDHNGDHAWFIPEPDESEDE